MAIKTFTTGEVLTAADTNTYLANAGLDYVSGASFSNVTTADITGFTTTYGSFRLILNVARHASSGNSGVTATMRDGTNGMTTGYYGAGFQITYLGGSTVTGTRNNGADFYLTTVANQTSVCQVAIDISAMNQASVNPRVAGVTYDGSQTGPAYIGYESTARTLSPDRIRIACAVGITGTWRLYGYRQA